ncbi:MAG: AraC family transcriptional regulator [Oscillospiraceae bacterium]|nr:AraC family transcriptional regulator [Oscillospiraceae bacterium]
MAINQNIYPYGMQVKNLPVYLTGIGGSEYQYHVKRPEGYNWHQILFSAKGRGCLKFDNTTVTLEENSFFFLPAGYPHEYFPVGNSWDVRWTAFDGYACRHILSEFGMTKPVSVKLEDPAPMQSLFNKMLAAQKSDIVYGDYTCSGLIYQYMIEFHRLCSDKSFAGGTDRSDILVPVLNYIDENFRENFPMTVLAEQAGVSPQHLCRIFKQTMNMRPNEYLTRRRIKEAKQLLTDTRLTVAEVGERSGFPDTSYFSTVFKRYEGTSPSEYKKSESGKAGI